MAKRPANVHDAYHAHIYFDADTVEKARALATQAAGNFKVAMGRVHVRPVGPHPMWSVQLAFSRKEFDKLVPWLDEHRDGMDVFVHGITGDDLADHTEYAYWLGSEHTLDLTALS